MKHVFPVILASILPVAAHAQAADSSPLLSQSSDPQWNWATADTVGDYAVTQSICRHISDRLPPRSDAPTAEEATALKGCDSFAFFYGVVVEQDPVKARHCAFIEATSPATDSWAPFSGTGLLMTIYANGVGVERDLDVATALACRIEGAPAEVDARINHLQSLAARNGPGIFDFCDDITSGASMGICAARDARLEDAKRFDRISTLTSDLSPEDKKLFDPLRQLARTYARTSAANEIDLSGSARSAFQIAQEQGLMDDFAETLTTVIHSPSDLPRPEDFGMLDGELNDVYGQIMSITTPPDANLTGEEDALPYSTVTKSGIRATERLWIDYRESWVTFAASLQPDLAPDSLRAELTRQRIVVLQGLLP